MKAAALDRSMPQEPAASVAAKAVREAGDLERAIELDHDPLARLAAMPWPPLIDTYGVITSRAQSGVNNDTAVLWILTATGTPIRQVLPSSPWQSEARWDPASS
jgi:hypothetical protein